MSRVPQKLRSLLVLTVGLFAAFVMSLQTVKADDAGFWEAMQEGGKVVLLRHAAIDKTGSPFVLDETCFEERVLNDLGKQQSKWLAEQFHKYAVVVDEVRTSPHCRTQQTANLAFPNHKVKVDPMFRLTKAISSEKAQANLQATRELIANWNGEGNLILVTHRPNIGELAYERIEPAGMVMIEMLDVQSSAILERLAAPTNF